MKTLLENEYHKIDLENGIIIATWKTNLIDLTAAKEISTNRQKLTSGKKYPYLVKMNSIKESTVEARDFLASETNAKDIVAAALFVDSLLGDFISTFFVAINKPKVPYKIFNDEKKAKKWLAKYVKKD